MIVTTPTEPIVSGGYWTSSWEDEDGARHRKRFGNAGKVSVSEMRRRFKNWLANWHRTPSMSGAKRFKEHNIADLVIEYMAHAQTYYRRQDGQPTGEAANMGDALKTLNDLFADTTPQDFCPAHLQAIQQQMIKDGLSRTTINARVNRVRRFFKWATVRGYVKGVMEDLMAVPPLAAGRSAAKEPEPIRPVHESIVEATFAAMAPTMRDMVELHHLSGMRSGELVVMRWRDVEVVGKRWVYRPAHHKTTHLRKSREIFIGPKCQEILAKHNKPDVTAFIFQPADVMLEHREMRRAARKSPMTPSQAKREHAEPKLSSRYTSKTYYRAIERACDKAFPAPPEMIAALKAVHRWKRDLNAGESTTAPTAAVVELAAQAEAWRKDNRWTPHQLRHACATRLRKQYGLEQARIILGHSSMETTEIYAEIDRDEAARIMGEVG